MKDERRYYEDLLKYSREHLMLYPYHLSDVIVKGLRITPFSYYVTIMADIMTQEKSYDSLPNFTAADCKLIWGDFFLVSQIHYNDMLNCVGYHVLLFIVASRVVVNFNFFIDLQFIVGWFIDTWAKSLETVWWVGNEMN